MMQQQRDDSDKNGGLIASGLSWFDKQREKRRREYLQQEAEKQLQKIGEAQRASLREAAAAAKGNTTFHGTTSAAVATATNDNNDNCSSSNAVVNYNRSLVDSSSCSDSAESPNDIEFVAANRSRSLDSAASGSSDSEQEEAATMMFPGLACGSSGGNNNSETRRSNSRRQKEQQQQQEEEQYATHQSNSFGTSDVSKSGEGASGMLFLSDIDGIFCDDENYEDEVDDATNQNNNDDTKNNGVNDNDDEIIYPVRVTHVEGDEASPYILSQDQMNEISKHVLPETIAYCRWRRLYGLGRDGDSFDGCLRIIGTVKRTLMVVRTTKGDVFGGYADAPWHSRGASSTAKFYGSASSCLFSFSSIRGQSGFSTSSSPESSSINVYQWTGKNRYIQVCDVSNKMLAFGGGGDKGAFGLCLQEDFQRGTTGHCDTFDNDPLCSEPDVERTFDIVDVEFWEFLTGVF
jgi:hypothetical protein